MSRCGQTNCAACPFVKEGNSVKVGSNEKWQIRKKVNCQTYNCIYMIECKKCGKRYVGETGRMLKARFQITVDTSATRLLGSQQETTLTCQATAWQT